MSLTWKSLFSGKGRIDRTTFWTVQLLLAVFEACLKATGTLFPSEFMLVVLAPLSIASFVVGVFNLAKRLHDLGRSGWWMLLPMAIAIVIVALAAAQFGRGSDGALSSENLALLAPLAFVLAVGALKGNAGPNRFGPPPAASTAAAA